MDQFYTNYNIASKYFDIFKSNVDVNKFDIILEPSAGTGAFFKLLPKDKRQGIDLDPKYKEVIKMNFFDFKSEEKKYIVIGNPPFGRGCSTAIKFFNHAAKFADIIAFIIPRTFKRISVQNKLDMNFHLIYSDDLPMKPCPFTPNIGAKCCFQIWEKRVIPRVKNVLPRTHTDFKFLAMGPKDKKKQPTPPKNADFAMKAYGSNCGKIVTDKLETLRPKSWHWFKSDNAVDLIEKFKQLDFSISKDTVRQDSIGRAEVVKLYVDKFD